MPGLKDQTRSPTKCAHFERRLQAPNFRFAGAYRRCIAVAETLYREARHLVDYGCGDVGAARRIAARTAIALMTAEQQLGHHEKVTQLVPAITGWLSTIGDTEYVGSLQIKRIESLLELGQVDQAERDINILQQKVLPPRVQLSLQVLTVKLRKLRAGGPEPPVPEAETALHTHRLLREIFAELIRSAAELRQSRADFSSPIRLKMEMPSEVILFAKERNK